MTYQTPTDELQRMADIREVLDEARADVADFAKENGMGVKHWHLAELHTSDPFDSVAFYFVSLVKGRKEVAVKFQVTPTEATIILPSDEAVEFTNDLLWKAIGMVLFA